MSEMSRYRWHADLWGEIDDTSLYVKLYLIISLMTSYRKLIIDIAELTMVKISVIIVNIS